MDPFMGKDSLRESVDPMFRDQPQFPQLSGLLHLSLSMQWPLFCIIEFEIPALHSESPEMPQKKKYSHEM